MMTRMPRVTIQAAVVRLLVVTVVVVVVVVQLPVVVDAAYLKSRGLSGSNDGAVVVVDDGRWLTEYDGFMQSMDGTSYHEKKMAALDQLRTYDEDGRQLQLQPPAAQTPKLVPLAAKNCKKQVSTFVTLEDDGWYTTKTGTTGSWKISTDNMQATFSIQDTNCPSMGGGTPTQVAWAYIWMYVNCEATLDLKVTGLVGTDNVALDYLNIFVDKNFVHQESSSAGSGGCKMDSSAVRKQASTITLSPGYHDIAIQYASNAATYHSKASYDVKVMFQQTYN